MFGQGRCGTRWSVSGNLGEINHNAGVGGTNNFLTSNGRYRDPSAWYHFVIIHDTTQATASNRVRIYINGTEITFSSASYPAQNADMNFNNTETLTIGRGNVSDTEVWLGYMAEYRFIDGTALDPSYFGETDTITGAWIPKKYIGSYGTQGYYLKFDPSATNGIGHDHSGNGNNFTATGFSTSGTGTDVMSDTPTTNYATINPLLKTSQLTVSDGNLVLSADSSDYGIVSGTIGMSSGKWYWECTTTSTGTANVHGIVSSTSSAFSSFTSTSRSQAAGFWGAQQGFAFRENGSSVGGTAPSGSVVMLAVDVDAQKYWYGVDGTWYNSGNPASGTNPTSSNLTANETWHPFNELRSTTPTHTLNFGQRAFAYTPPTGFKALNTANLPEPTIKKGSAHFNTVLYTGDGASPRAITGVGFAPDFTWIKLRSQATNHVLQDKVRGATAYLNSNNTLSENTNTQVNFFSSFDSDGFTIRYTAANGFNYYETNLNGNTYVAWNWKANGAGSSNTAGSITSTVSANASAGFSIVTYTGTGSAATVGHGLGVAPSMIFTKYRNAAGYDWYFYHKNVTSGKYLRLNTTEAEIGPDTTLYSSAPSSTVINYGSSTGVVANGGTYVAYCFSEVAGYSKFGSYTGNGSSDGPFVFCGFKPAFLLRKSAINAADDWVIQDLRRPGYNETKDTLTSNQAYAEVTNSHETGVDILSNGFKVRSSNYKTNYNGATYIFAAYAESPTQNLFGGQSNAR